MTFRKFEQSSAQISLSYRGFTVKVHELIHGYLEVGYLIQMHDHPFTWIKEKNVKKMDVENGRSLNIFLMTV
jgi:hypothetical protein